jgi:hypothetical protein
MPKHYIITNRHVEDERRRIPFSNDGKEEARYDLRFGTVEFNDKGKRFKVDLYPDPFRDLSDNELSTFMRGGYLDEAAMRAEKKIGLGSTTMFGELHPEIGQCNFPDSKQDILVFVHGFK